MLNTLRLLIILMNNPSQAARLSQGGINQYPNYSVIQVYGWMEGVNGSTDLLQSSYDLPSNSTVHYCTVKYSTVQYSIVQYSTDLSQ